VPRLAQPGDRVTQGRSDDWLGLQPLQRLTAEVGAADRGGQQRVDPARRQSPPTASYFGLRV